MSIVFRALRRRLLRACFEIAVERISSHDAKIVEIERSLIQLIENIKPVTANVRSGVSSAEVNAFKA